MGWAIRNIKSHSGAGTDTLAVVAGDLIVQFSGATSGQSGVASDNVNGTYSTVGPYTTARPSAVRICYKIASTTATVTIDPHGTADSWGAASWSHTDGVIPATVNTSGNAAASTLNLSTGAANTLIVAVSDGSGSNTPGTGFSVIHQVLNGFRITSEYETDMTNAQGTNAVSFTQSIAQGMLAVAFNPPAAATDVIPLYARSGGLGIQSYGLKL